MKTPAFLLAIALVCSAQNPPAGDAFLLRGGTVHTISGPVIENGAVLVRDGKIVGVGKDLAAPEGVQVIDVTGQQVYPGMIDAASSIGLEKSSDAQERGLFNPQLVAAQAMNPAAEHIPGARANGVTSVVEMPEGDLIAGQMSLVRMDSVGSGSPSASPVTAIHLRFPAIVTVPLRPSEPDDDDDDPREPEPIPYSLAKRDYDVKMRALTKFFDDARRYRRAKLAKSRSLKPDLRFEAMLPVLDDALPMFVTAVREREIREALLFAAKQKIKIILANSFEAYKVIPQIKASGFPVVLGPSFALPLDRDDPYDRAFTTPGELFKAGIPFCIATFSSKSTRNLPYQAAAAVPFGLPHDEAYKAVSLNVAEIFGFGKRLGSIDEGKTADLIVTDGDPMESRTHVNLVFIDGKPVSVDTRQKQLYEKYSKRP